MLKHFFIVILSVVFVFGLEGVTDLTDSNFDELVKNDSSIWLVAFTA